MSKFSMSASSFGKKIVKKAANTVKDKAIDYAKERATEAITAKLNESPKVQELKAKATGEIMSQVNAHKEELISLASKTLGMDESEIRQIWDTVADPESVIREMMSQAQGSVDTNPDINVGEASAEEVDPTMRRKRQRRSFMPSAPTTYVNNEE